MKFTLGEIRGMKEPLGSLIEKEIPIQAAWKLNRLIKSFDKELNDIEDFRIGLVQKLGKKGKDGEVKVPKNKLDDFVNEFNELLNQEVEVDFDGLSIDIFGDISMSSRDLMMLEKIFQ